jgi:hypothetical protein
MPLELWPGACDEREVRAELRCTLGVGHAGAHFDAAAMRHFLVSGDAVRIAREQRRAR